MFDHNELQDFGLTKTEAYAYTTLLQHGNMNGSQLAKIMNLSRSSVYTALNSLYNKGAIYLMPDEDNSYFAKDPEVFLDELTSNYSNKAGALKKKLKGLFKKDNSDGFWNFKGNQTFINKVKELLLSAKKEIYINTNYDLNLFSDEIHAVHEKGVRVILFTFFECNYESLPIEVYYNSKFKGLNTNRFKMLLSIDSDIALIASHVKESETLGTFSKNPLLVSLVSEHIHHDIYRYKIEKKFNLNLEDEKDMRLGTQLEEQFRKHIEGLV